MNKYIATIGCYQLIVAENDKEAMKKAEELINKEYFQILGLEVKALQLIKNTVEVNVENEQ
jgi:hypothetical protein